MSSKAITDGVGKLAKGLADTPHARMPSWRRLKFHEVFAGQGCTSAPKTALADGVYERLTNWRDIAFSTARGDYRDKPSKDVQEQRIKRFANSETVSFAAWELRGVVDIPRGQGWTNLGGRADISPDGTIVWHEQSAAEWLAEETCRNLAIAASASPLVVEDTTHS